MLYLGEEYKNILWWGKWQENTWVEETGKNKAWVEYYESSCSFIWREGGASKMIRKKMGKEDWEQNEKDLSCHNSGCHLPYRQQQDKIFHTRYG